MIWTALMRLVEGLLAQHGSSYYISAFKQPKVGLFDHQIAGQRLSWRLVGFTDAGRAWTDLHDQTLVSLNLDGQWYQFLMGLGAGLRLRWGQAFVLRIDTAWSPHANTTGLYFGTDHIF